MREKEQEVEQFLKDQNFLKFLMLKGIPVTSSVDRLHKYVVNFKLATVPIVNDGNINV